MCVCDTEAAETLSSGSELVSDTQHSQRTDEELMKSFALWLFHSRSMETGSL